MCGATNTEGDLLGWRVERVEDAEVLNRLPDSLADLLAPSHVGVWQQQGEFLTTIPSGYVCRPSGLLCQDPGDRAKTCIARLMPVLIVETLEMIDVHQQQ